LTSPKHTMHSKLQLGPHAEHDHNSSLHLCFCVTKSYWHIFHLKLFIIRCGDEHPLTTAATSLSCDVSALAIGFAEWQRPAFGLEGRIQGLPRLPEVIQPSNGLSSAHQCTCRHKALMLPICWCLRPTVVFSHTGYCQSIKIMEVAWHKDSRSRVRNIALLPPWRLMRSPYCRHSVSFKSLQNLWVLIFFSCNLHSIFYVPEGKPPEACI